MTALRAAAPHDADLIDRAFLAARSDLAASLPEQIRDDVLAMQRAARDRDFVARFPAAKWWLMTDGTDDVGALLLDETLPEFQLIDLVVFTEHRGRGHASVAVAHVTRIADAAGARVALTAAVDNAVARRIYERASFVATGRTATDIAYLRAAA